MSSGPENSDEPTDEALPSPGLQSPLAPLTADSAVTQEPAPPVALPAPAITPPAPVDRYIANRERIEREFHEVRRIVLFYGAILTPILILLGWCFHRKNSDTLTAELVLGSIAYSVIAFFVVCWRHELRGLFTWPRTAGARIWIITAVTPLLTLTCITLARHAIAQIGWPIEPVLSPAHIARWPIAAFYLWIGLCPALFEEIAFRGLLLAKLKRLMTPIQAIWVTTLLFGIIHFDILAMAIFLIPLAWIAGWLTHRTGSLWPAMIIHFVHNAGVLTLELLR
ncbi:hypothetical protein CMV30_15595 [Nibricoccus aquaticus]|uniref:CAAX prenyl protease 2/Lysostaphin resistance protein A-like domain-containing protein n=1 Tax=Nibricoccus aquaticus TaxID=2576891 RepID=A0A290QDG3_9BACT|nr:type II CAAX endopeptidase family protein [Nibricoccus aquaticus]ATC65260.1 hypothetical protein CMV30_15595 [Nibricoccus aquaticus]